MKYRGALRTYKKPGYMSVPCVICGKTIPPYGARALHQTPDGRYTGEHDCKNCHAKSQYLHGGKTQMRRTHLWRQYKITPEDYDRLLKAQHGVCAICGQPETKRHRSGEPFELAVDHDHKTGKVRGLLCDRCNHGLARFDDDPARFRAAADYLERSQGGQAVA